MKAILFDCDGVLVNSEPTLAKVSANVMNARGIPAKPEDFLQYIGTGEDTYLGKVVEKYNGKYTSELKDTVYQEYITQGIKDLESFPGCEKMLNDMAQKGVTMAVASSADKIKLDANLSTLDFDAEKFAAIISGSDITRKKPWPDIYLLAAEKSNVEPEDCIVVEDAVAGIESGNRAGMVTIGFTSNLSAQALKEAGADYVVDTFFEMEEILEKLLKL
ncbi:MAG: HAD family phosphatase [Clostridiaceae bacterium]|nr:HAD family phosphatase [Clostridiaceae bacterium]